MKKIRLSLAYVFEPVVRLCFYALLRLMGHSPLRIGTLTFWGEPEFLATCETAVRRLQNLDTDLHTSLTHRLKLMFYHSPKHLEQVWPIWFFSIDDAYA